MSIEKVRAYMRQFNIEDRIIEFPTSSATVELAAQAAGCEPARIAKTLSFKLNDNSCVLSSLAASRISWGMALKVRCKMKTGKVEKIAGRMTAPDRTSVV